MCRVIWCAAFPDIAHCLNARYRRKEEEGTSDILMWLRCDKSLGGFVVKQLLIVNRLLRDGCDTAEWYKTIKLSDSKWLFTPFWTSRYELIWTDETMKCLMLQFTVWWTLFAPTAACEWWKQHLDLGSWIKMSDNITAAERPPFLASTFNLN